MGDINPLVCILPYSALTLLLVGIDNNTFKFFGNSYRFYQNLHSSSSSTKPTKRSFRAGFYAKTGRQRCEHVTVQKIRNKHVIHILRLTCRLFSSVNGVVNKAHLRSNYKKVEKRNRVSTVGCINQLDSKPGVVFVENQRDSLARQGTSPNCAPATRDNGEPRWIQKQGGHTKFRTRNSPS